MTRFVWLFCVSVAWISMLTYTMLIITTRVGCILEIPKVVMGIVVISAGTTVPDCLSSILVAKKGEGDMAVSNAIGSNIFNIFMCLGFPWLLYTLVKGKPYESPALRGNIVIPIVLLLL